MGGDHPSGHTVAGYLERPTRGLGRAALVTPAHTHREVRASALLRVGFTEPARSPVPLVRSYRTVSPLPTSRPAVCSLWHCPAGHPGLPLTTTLLYGVRTFLDARRGGRPPVPRTAAARPTRSRTQDTPGATAQNIRGQTRQCAASLTSRTTEPPSSKYSAIDTDARSRCSRNSSSGPTPSASCSSVLMGVTCETSTTV